MLKITVELIHSSGDVNLNKVLGEAIIFNDAMGTEESGNYKYRLERFEDETKVVFGRIDNFPRRKLHFWHLVHAVLDDWKEKFVYDN